LAAIAAVYVAFAVPLCLPPFECLPDVRIDIASSQFDVPGSDNPSREYVCLVNEEGGSVDLTGWELRDAEGKVNVLPDFTLEADASVRVHPGQGTNSPTDLYGSEGRSVWNNEGDSVTLIDDGGKTIDQVSYGATEASGGGDCGS
jgi:hypothetical protein